MDRQFTVSAPNEVWCTDVIYIRHQQGWLYLALVIDLYARQIVGWACSNSPDTVLTTRALSFAYQARGCPSSVLLHTDQGCHYTSQSFQNCLKRYAMIPSMSRRATCWDNVIIERTFRTLKTEWMPRSIYESYHLAEHDIFQFIKYYNYRRCHSYNNYLPPAIAEQQFLAA